MSVWSRALLGLGVVLLVVAFSVFAIFYWNYRSSIKHRPAKTRHQAKRQNRIHGVVIAIFAFLTFLVISMILCFAAILGLRKVEQKNLFKSHQNRPLSKIEWHDLQPPFWGSRPQHHTRSAGECKARPVSPGNTGNLEYYRDPLDKIAEFGYNVFAVEYRGYGPTQFDGSPNADTLIQDAQDAWNLMGTSDSIVAGFSIGGAVLSQIYEQLVPAPAQIVFLNSFGDLGALLEDKLGGELGGTCVPLMATQWSVKDPPHSMAASSLCSPRMISPLAPNMGNVSAKSFPNPNSRVENSPEEDIDSACSVTSTNGSSNSSHHPFPTNKIPS